MTEAIDTATASNGAEKRELVQLASSNTKKAKQPKKYNRRYRPKPVDPTAPMGVLQYEIKDILKEHGLKEEDIANDMKEVLNDQSVFEIYHRVVENAEISRLTSNGDGIALIPHPVNADKKQIAVVPFGYPGDIVTIRIFKSHPLYVESDLLKVTQASETRNEDLIQCKYFGKCSGCQYQNVEYAKQLEFKRQTIVNAYKYFAPWSSEGKLPIVDATQSSPLQYGYRTKLTPHFDVPHKIPEDYARPSFGFGSKGRPQWRESAEGGNQLVIDIENCPIGTPIINKGFTNERLRYMDEFKKYKKGSTVLLRENTVKLENDGQTDLGSASVDAEGTISRVDVEINDVKYVKTCVTEPRQVVREVVNGYTFEFSAGEFFQNNNLILPIVTEYVKMNLQIEGSEAHEPNYLVDAYCGSGLFSITCLTGVSKVIGVEVSADSVKFAERNARLNGIENAKFIVGKAEEIFKNIDSPSNRTSVILDPPRKGCDHVFLKQLADYCPAKIVYISCNVHSQARDIEWFLKETKEGSRYTVESIKGFDFFPQTHHVESIAVLTLNK